MPNSGHIFDGNTLALWRFDEASGTAAADEGGVYPLTAVATPPIVLGLIGNARSFNGTTQYFTGANNPAAVTALLGPASVEAWVLVDPSISQSGFIFCFGDNDEILSENALLAMRVEPNGALDLSWEYGAGVGVGSTSPPGVVPFGVWVHVASTRAPVMGGHEVRHYVNGVLVSTSGVIADGPAGGTASEFTVGRFPGFSTTSFKGQIDDVRVSKVTRSGPEILASYQAGVVTIVTGKGHIQDANTLALWRLDEATAATNFVDAVGTFPITVTNSPAVVSGRVGTGRGFDGTTQYAFGNANATVRAAFLDSVTWEGWLWINPAWVSINPAGPFPSIFALSNNVDGSILRLGSLGLARSGGALFWSFTPSVGVFSSPISLSSSQYPLGKWFHLAIRKTWNGVSNTYDAFINGALVQTNAGVANPAASPAANFNFSRYEGFVAEWFAGRLDDIRISNVARSDAAIQESYERGILLPRGHILDPFTLSLWRMNESTAASNFTDATGLHTLTQVGSPPVVTTAIIDGGRTFDDTRYATKAGGITDYNNALVGDYSIEVWVKPDVFRQNDVVLTYAAAGETAGANYLVAFTQHISGFLRVFWEFGAGVNVEVIQTTGDPLTLGEWQHVALTMQIVNGLRTVRMYRNGVKQFEQAGLTPADGGTSGSLYIARNGPSTGNNWQGSMDDMRFSTVMRTDAEVLNSYNRGLGVVPEAHTLDANTLALWRFEEANAGDAAAEENGLYPLTTVVASPAPGFGLFGSARTFNGTTTYFTRPGEQTALDALKLDVTVEAWVVLTGAIGAPYQIIFNYGGPGTFGNLAERFQIEMAVDTSNRLVIRWQNAGGIVALSTLGALPLNQWIHVAARRRTNGAGGCIAELFVNGARIRGAPGLVYPDGGTNAQFNVGVWTGAPAEILNARVEEIRVSNVARSDAEILQSYLNGAGLLPVPVFQNRLPIDDDLVAYWGLDESNPVDISLDESSNANHLALGAPVATGRVGNGRLLDGGNYEGLVKDNLTLRLYEDLTIICWARLDSVNSTGSLLRTILSYDGILPGTSADRSLYNVSVDNLGMVVYRHEATAGLVEVKTVANVIKVSRLHSIAVRRFDAGGGNQTIEIYVDNRLQALSSVTVNGVGSALPVPPPTGGTAGYFKLGRSTRVADLAQWHGVLDEVSIHKVARPVQPYLNAAYFQAITLERTFRLSTIGNINNIASAEMGGFRWWTYDRDDSVYVVREGPLGTFSQEVQLTTTGTTSSGGTVLPELIYDVANDLLVVIFLSAGRVFKITAGSSDAPVTQNMPFTADTPTIIKARDQADLIRVGGGGTTRPFDTVTPSYPATPTIFFTASPSFGLVAAVPSGGYFMRFYQRVGGTEILLATYSYPSQLVSGVYFHPISQRVFGNTYFCIPVFLGGNPVGQPSNAIVDFLGRGIETVDGSLVRIGSPNGDVVDGNVSGGGGSALDMTPGVSMITRGAVKNISEDPAPVGTGGGGTASELSSLVSMITRGAVKSISEDPNPVGTGGGGGLGIAMADNRGHNFP